MRLNAERKLKVICIIGTARSGSTILSAVLGSAPKVVSVGELARLFTDLRSGTRQCACGKPGIECERWQAVLSSWSNKLGPQEVANYEREIARYQKLRAAPKLLRYHAAPSKTLSDLIGGTEWLLQSISEQFESDTVVDSSKAISRVLLYAKIPGVDLRVLHLVRDVRGVVWSRLGRQTGLRSGLWPQAALAVNAAAQAVRWAGFNLLSGLVIRQGRISLERLRYEDLLENPTHSLEWLSEFTGLDLDPALRKLAGHEPFAFGHMISGNRIRLGGPVAFDADLDWESQMPGIARRLAWGLSMPISLGYGYRPW